MEKKTRLKRRILIIAVVLIAVAGVVLAAKTALNKMESNLEGLMQLDVTDVDLTLISDGTYIGEYAALPVSAKVSVTIQDHRITNIDLLEHNNGQGAGAEVIPSIVVEKQSLQINTISGATYSSKVILKAIENALQNSIDKLTRHN
jgi:uncharacterized protein with FMN-binding domain